ncbi:tetratricopeptide repeat protein [Schaalia vaccimaxillae]|uniref:tetratricopeptide repeat protein n=1 Tax=Schaalia vaccimaxillae TaxID=183916 RepID=UPI0003B79FE0|nr:tetratricopeptide repeat protein [Schaalia vaccimaxillae]
MTNEQIFAQAVALLRAEQPGQVLAILENLARDNGTETRWRAHMLSAAAHMQARDFARAEESARAALAFTPDNCDVLQTLGAAQDAGGRTAEAIETYERAVATGAAPASIFISLAFAYAQKNQTKLAVQAAARALELVPQDARAHAAMGRALHDTKPREAARHYQQALALDPSDETARELLADVSYDAEGFRAGLKQSMDLLVQDPTRTAAHRMMIGQILQRASVGVAGVAAICLRLIGPMSRGEAAVVLGAVGAIVLLLACWAVWERRRIRQILGAYSDTVLKEAFTSHPLTLIGGIVEIAAVVVMPVGAYVTATDPSGAVARFVDWWAVPLVAGVVCWWVGAYRTLRRARGR